MKITFIDYSKKEPKEIEILDTDNDLETEQDNQNIIEKIKEQINKDLKILEW
jgi:hypothetical protein